MTDVRVLATVAVSPSPIVDAFADSSSTFVAMAASEIPLDRMK